MATSPSWRLKRYGRCIPDSTGGKQWKVFESNDNGPEMFLTIVKSGYLLVLQGQESLDTIPFLGGSVKGKVELEPEVVTGSLTIRRLTQHILGESAVTLPRAYRDPPPAAGDLEPVLRLCLLDPGFPAFVESVEDELKKLLEG
ncbi:Meiotic recombination protein REC114 [Liparis tanakae]|uniref:Meiotic recombination protein REC114 n=1 Tax=Liparis tanakae TaxID=230148 RepID=A0A4Z2FRX6_9TELE|nr:Meiotic recombination protein REC114 [Liparis tanakae]